FLVAATPRLIREMPQGERALVVLASLFFSLGSVVRSIHYTQEKSYYDPPVILEKMPLTGRIYHSPQTMDSFQTMSGKSVAEIYLKQKQALLPNLPLAYGREDASFNNTLFLGTFL